MKFTVNSSDLLKALSVVSGVVPAKSTLPILESVLFCRKGDSLVLSASDLEISVVHQIPVQFESNGQGADFIAVPARRLIETLNSLSDVVLTFSGNEHFQIKLQTTQGKYQMAGVDGKDFPALPQTDEGVSVMTTGAVLKRMVQKTTFAVSHDSIRPAMTGIFFHLEADRATAVATDGHRLVKMQRGGIHSAQPINCIIPDKAFNLIAKVIGEDSCTLKFTEGYIGVDGGDTQIVARLINETYPNYEAVIPQNNDKTLTVNRQMFQAAVNRVGLYSSSMTKQIRFKLTASEVFISAEDIERSSEARESVLCEYDGEEMEIGFNATYLKEVLKNVDTEEVLLKFSTPNRAGVVLPSDEDEDERILMLIMPVMLSQHA